jgi:hypothetical protein
MEVLVVHRHSLFLQGVLHLSHRQISVVAGIYLLEKLRITQNFLGGKLSRDEGTYYRLQL